MTLAYVLTLMDLDYYQ